MSCHVMCSNALTDVMSCYVFQCEADVEQNFKDGAKVSFARNLK